jgi:rubrerythrin
MRAPELAAVEVPGMTRGAFILRGALAAGAVYGVQAVTPFVDRALAAASAGDLDVMSFALSLENLEAAFYKTALSKGALAADVKKLATELGGHEQEHVAALSNALQILGGNVPKPGAYTFPITDQPSFLKLAAKLEDTGVAAYNGAAPNIQSEDILATLGSIVQVEARHAAAMRERAGQLPAPDAFDRTLTAAQVTAAIKPFGGP